MAEPLPVHFVTTTWRAQSARATGTDHFATKNRQGRFAIGTLRVHNHHSDPAAVVAFVFASASFVAFVSL